MAKSVEVRFHQACEALKKANKFKTFEEQLKPQKEKLGLVPIEVQLNLAETVLKDAGVVRESATGTMGEAVQQLSAAQYQVFSEQRKKNPNMSWEEQLKLAEAILRGEFKPATKKNNGAASNFVEGSPFNGDRANSFSPGYVQETTNPCTDGDRLIADWMLKNGKINEAQHRKLTGQKPEGYEQLSEQQRKEFDFARLINISEADAFKVAKMAGNTFKEVSRR